MTHTPKAAGWAVLLALASLAATGCGNALGIEGEACNVNGECPTPESDLFCYYGTCRKGCRESSVCGSGKTCSCAGGQAAFSAGGKSHGTPFGVCLAGCTADADCAGTRRCREATVEESGRNSIPPKVPTVEVVCLDSPAVCGGDGFCHALCSGPSDFCDDAANVSNDRCTPEPDGGAFQCSSASVCGK